MGYKPELPPFAVNINFFRMKSFQFNLIIPSIFLALPKIGCRNWLVFASYLATFLILKK